MEKPVVHLICSAHLDPVWQWRWEEGCAEAVSTFRNAVTLLREHDKLIFNHNEALLYDWIQQHDPELFNAIKKLVNRGRWAISGGWYLQPDANLPGTESLIRHIRNGRGFFKRNFNVIPRVAYNFDSFGHSGGLPQILVKTGYRMYIHMRPQADQLELPADLYRWRGVDGSEILAYRIAVGLYHTEVDNIEKRLLQGVELALELGRDVPVFWGLGNHGGGATREDLRIIDSFSRDEKRVGIIHSTPETFFKSIKRIGKEAPVFEGDLQNVFTGCYTSLARVKRRAVESLGLLRQAETAAAVTWWTLGATFPRRELRDAWSDHLFNDFHDILPGTCIEPAEQDALDRYGRASEAARAVRLKAVAAANRRIKGQRDLPITVLNTNPGLRRTPVEVEFMLSHRPPWTGQWHVTLFRADGTVIPCQEEQPEALLPFKGWRRKISFMDGLPDVGFARYYVEARAGKRSPRAKKARLDIEFSRQHGLINKINLGGGLQLLDAPLLQPLVLSDEADTWGTQKRDHSRREGRFRLIPESVSIIEKGPVRTVYESEFRYNRSRLVMHTIAYADWPVLEYRIRLHWSEARKRVKLSVPTRLKNDKVVAEIPGGHIPRAADGEEHVHRRWLYLEDRIEGRNVALGIAHNGLHGFDARRGEIRLSALRSAAYCHEQGFELRDYPSRKYMDMGVHTIRMLVTAGDALRIRRELPAFADWLSCPPFALAHWPLGAMREERGRPERISARAVFVESLSIQPENIRLLACYSSRAGRGLILRVQEAAGLSSQLEIRARTPKVHFTTGMEPLEIKTLFLDKIGSCQEVSTIEETV